MNIDGVELTMNKRQSSSSGAQRSDGGQILVLFVFALFAIIAMIALVIEGSNLFAEQRMAQNGSDAAANAGTIIVAEHLSGKSRTDQAVYNAINQSAIANKLTNYTAEYTDDFGTPIGLSVSNVAQPVPDGARGVHVDGSRVAGTSFARVLGINDLTATADATVVAGALSTQCVAEDDGCTLLPVTFPVAVFQCDGSGNLIPEDWTWVGPPPEGADPGDPYWPIVGAEDLPNGGNAGPDLNPANGNEATEAILPLCKGSGTSTGTFGWLDLARGMNLADEITGPLNTTVNIPDWFQTQTGNPNSVEDELLAYWHKPVLIPLHNQACREDPGDTDECPTASEGKDPTGNNTWYYVHTLAVFYIDEVLVQGGNVDECASPPGGPTVPITRGAGFLGCLKGWFVNYVTAGPITPGEEHLANKPIGIQLIR
jgi:Flp pilus assembly protein TadG